MISLTILGRMTIKTDGAELFDDRVACQRWIDERVVRFKLKMVRARTPDGEETYIPQKFGGRLVNTKAEDFKASGTDEPLSNYASPVRQDDKWMAVMRLQGA